ncbi:hypothetical protein PSA7680_01133 [Pseudoruegeria aquimaris]|uniref:Uncharacterized protein n=1 Tax=Pseudoruegeria aquimaris TaxID=393663 RepID=A0A1Y5RUZ2_9RHOB|nr:hypothetical protein [Pseudoruegeria aquimaris]SLN26123.1 hypothetical protein PSA7680_01133 [Pseudoruegeria aquimaris]
MTREKNVFLFAFFYLLFGMQKLGHALAIGAARLCAAMMRLLHGFWHGVTALVSSLIDALAHGRAESEEIRKRNVEYLGYVGFASWATSMALYILTAGPLGRYLAWLWATRVSPWMRGL